MRWKIVYSDIFEASFDKLIPLEIRPQVRRVIEWRLTRDPYKYSIKWPPQAKADLRADFLFVGRDIGWLRVLFEIRDSEIYLWGMSKGRSGKPE